MEAEVVGAALQQRDRDVHPRAARTAGRSFRNNWSCRGLAPVEISALPPASSTGARDSEGLAGAGAGFGDQRRAVVDGVVHRRGHVGLRRARNESRHGIGQGAAPAEDFDDALARRVRTFETGQRGGRSRWDVRHQPHSSRDTESLICSSRFFIRRSARSSTAVSFSRSIASSRSRVLDLQFDDAPLHFFLFHVRANRKSGRENAPSLDPTAPQCPIINPLETHFPRVQLPSQRRASQRILATGETSRTGSPSSPAPAILGPCWRSSQTEWAAGPGAARPPIRSFSTAENLFRACRTRTSTLRDLLLHLAAEAHTIIRLTAIPAEKEPHSTLCALVIQKQTAVWAHVGDSRLYDFRGGGLLPHRGPHLRPATAASKGGSRMRSLPASATRTSWSAHSGSTAASRRSRSVKKRPGCRRHLPAGQRRTVGTLFGRRTRRSAGKHGPAPGLGTASSRPRASAATAVATTSRWPS